METALPFVRHVGAPLRALWGDDAIDRLPAELDRLRAQRVVIVCGRTLAGSAELNDLVRPVLGARCAGIFAEVAPHSPVPSVMKAADLLREVEADAVLAIGGGSAVVTARAASILAAESADVGALATQRDANGRMVSPRLSAPKIPNLVLATTPTTAYAKAGAAVRDPATGERLALFDPKARATAVIFDPRLAATAPSGLVRGSALNAFAMAVDGLQAAGADPLAEAMLAQGLRDAIRFLPDVDDAAARVRLMLAALMTGIGSDAAGTGLAQALSHALGPISTAANGVIEALLLPHTAAYNLGTTDAGLTRVGELLPEGGGDVAEVPAALREYLRTLGSPMRLRDVGVERSQLADVVAHAGDDWAITRVPRPAGPAELTEILAAAW